MPIILGADKAGKSLLAGILNCSPYLEYESLLTDKLSYRSFSKFGLKILDMLHAEWKPTQKFIWVIRDPLESSCSMNKEGINYKEALSYWVDINTIIWYFLYSVPRERKMRIWFEELLLNDSAVKSSFDFAGIIFNKQYFKYGDFDQPPVEDPTFSKGIRDGEKVNFYEHNKEVCDHWDNVKDKKIVIQFGYTRSKSWDIR